MDRLRLKKLMVWALAVIAFVGVLYWISQEKHRDFSASPYVAYSKQENDISSSPLTGYPPSILDASARNEVLDTPLPGSPSHSREASSLSPGFDPERLPDLFEWIDKGLMPPAELIRQIIRLQDNSWIEWSPIERLAHYPSGVVQTENYEANGRKGYHENGQLRWEFPSSQTNGSFFERLWYPDGTLQAVIPIRSSKGYWLRFYPNGNLAGLSWITGSRELGDALRFDEQGNVLGHLKD
jgi:hypothetical protein